MPMPMTKDQNYLRDSTIRTSDFLRKRYPDCVLIILADFSQLDVSGTTSDVDEEKVLQTELKLILS